MSPQAAARSLCCWAAAEQTSRQAAANVDM
jgi:hypothetical protein